MPYYTVCKLLLKELTSRDAEYKKVNLEKDSMIAGKLSALAGTKLRVL